MSYLQHPFGPLYNENSRVLILGSFPSVKSREQNFFYGHPQNRFWKVIAAVFGSPVPVSIEEKKQLILSNGLALWDSIASCEITGSSDASIRNARPNDIGLLLNRCKIERIYCNGRKSHELYCRYIEPQTGHAAICLPSSCTVRKKPYLSVHTRRRESSLIFHGDCSGVGLCRSENYQKSLKGIRTNNM